MRLPRPPGRRGEQRSARRPGPDRWWAGGVLGLLALAAAVTAAGYGSIRGDTAERALTFGGSAGFVVLGVAALHKLTNEASGWLAGRLGTARSAGLCLAVRIAGYAAIVLETLTLLSVPIGRLLLGGAITGIILGVAAQQSLANVFAGIVLQLSRPFTVGDRVAVHSGGLGGSYAGTVAEMGLTFVRLTSDEQMVLLPNVGVLTSAITPTPQTPRPAAEQPATP